MDKLKQAIWNTFDGQDYFRSSVSHVEQLSIFTSEDDKEYRAQVYSEEAYKLLSDFYVGKIIHYEELSHFVLEHTLLMSTQIINCLIKPKMRSGNIVKQNTVKSNNFKNDSYFIKEC